MQTFININFDSKTPKYKQVIDSIIAEIKQGDLKSGQRIPSINELSEENYLSRDTVEKAYNELRERGIISSVRGKGFFINRTDFTSPIRVLLVFNKISAYKKLVYNAFVKTLGEDATVDLHIHHFNVKLFESIINNNLGNYNYYVIMPHFYDSLQEAIDILKKIPKDKLILLDKNLKGFNGEYAAVYQDFELDIHQSLLSGIDLLTKYRRLNLVFPSSVPYPPEIRTGFINFCRQASFDYRILNELDTATKIYNKEAYIVIEETDLVNLIKKSCALQMKPGLDIGIISFNETPLKEILSDGITVISTDHEAMGKIAAEMILFKKKDKVKAPFVLIRRNSL
jgi:DNA-binding transcriptional regulator YhcF (GntR family)